MTIKVVLPKDIDENCVITQRLLDVGVPPQMAEAFGDTLQHAYEDKNIREAIEKSGHWMGNAMERQVRKCVFNSVIENIVKSVKISPKSCAGRIAYQVERYSKLNPAAVYRQMSNIAANAASNFRVKRARFNKHKFVTKLLQEYPNLNPSALEYLHLKGKLDLTKDDFETLTTFLELMIKKDEVS